MNKCKFKNPPKSNWNSSTHKNNKICIRKLFIHFRSMFYFYNPENVRNYRSRSQEVFCKKGVYRNFAKFTGKHLCQSLFFNKVAGLSLSLQLYLKKVSFTGVFPVNFAKLLRTCFLTEHLLWLLLHILEKSGSFTYLYIWISYCAHFQIF